MGDLTWLDPDEHRVFRAYARSARGLFLQLDRDMQRDIGMPGTYFEILWLLHGAPGRSLRMNELAEYTGSQPSRITHAIGRLEQAGQVRRELCTADRRGWFAVLTDRGLAALQLATPRHAQSIRDHLLDPLSSTERDQLYRIGETVLRHLEMAADRAVADSG